MRSSSRATLVLFSAAAIGCLAALSPVRAAEPDGLAALIGPAEALRIAIVTRASEKGAKGVRRNEGGRGLLFRFRRDPAVGR